MEETWRPVCLMSEYDDVNVACPIDIAVLEKTNSVRMNGLICNVDALMPSIVCVVSCSPLSEAAITNFEAYVNDQGYVLSCAKNFMVDRSQVGAVVSIALRQALVTAQHRIVKQAREISELRNLYERSLQSFERLEKFVWQTGMAERTMVVGLKARQSGPHFSLTHLIEQRIPTDSVGLSDLAIWIEVGGKGVLVAKLLLLESGEQCGEWRVQDPRAGWLRFGLDRALGTDTQTPALQLEWIGDTPLLLGLHADHPDKRYQSCGSAMIALRAWKFIAGVYSQLPPEAIAVSSQETHKVKMIGISDFRQVAVNAADPAHVQVVEKSRTLLLNPEPDYVVGVVFPSGASANASRFRAIVTVEGGGAHLAFVVCPIDHAPSEAVWTYLSADDVDQLNLELSTPLQATMDLWIIARAAGDTPCRVHVSPIEVW